MVLSAGFRPSWTPTISIILVAKPRAITPGDFDEDDQGDRAQPHFGSMNRGMRSLLVKDNKGKEKKGKNFVPRSYFNEQRPRNSVSRL